MLRVLDMTGSYKELVYCMRRILTGSYTVVPANLYKFFVEAADYLKSNATIVPSLFDFKFKEPIGKKVLFCSRGCESTYLKNTLDLSNVDCEEVFCFPTLEQKRFGKHGIKMEHEEFSLFVLGMYHRYSSSIFGFEYENPKYILPFFQGDTFCSIEFRDIVNKHFSKYGYTMECPMLDNKISKLDAYKYLIEHNIDFQPCDDEKPCCHCYKCAEYFWHFDALGYKCPITIEPLFLENIVKENKILMETKDDRYDSLTTWNQLESLGYRKWYQND